MKSNQLEPQKALSPAYKKIKLLKSDIDDFSAKLQECIHAINLVDTRNESEEHLKSPIKKFLASTFYKTNEINTKERIDLAVYLGENPDSEVGILIEAKKPSNRAEFPTVNQLNKKAFQEMLLYYLRERIGPNSLCYLVFQTIYCGSFFLRQFRLFALIYLFQNSQDIV